MTIDWELKKFKELSPQKLYNIMHLRAEVFIIEQQCFYQDADGKDAKSFHLLGHDSNDNLVAYSRILPSGVSYKEVSIGRVVVPKKVRKKEVGRALMIQAIDAVNKIYGNVSIRISAQCYLKDFYTEFGFSVIGEKYMEDGIPHFQMLRTPGIPH